MCNCPVLGKLGWVPHQDGRNCGWGWVSPAALAAVRGRGGLGARRVDGSASRGFLPPVQGQSPQATGVTRGARPPGTRGASAASPIDEARAWVP